MQRGSQLYLDIGHGMMRFETEKYVSRQARDARYEMLTAKKIQTFKFDGTNWETSRKEYTVCVPVDAPPANEQGVELVFEEVFDVETSEHLRLEIEADAS